MDALLRRRAMSAAGGGEPPTPVIEPVFYDRLVFDGTAYIKTDIIPDANASYLVALGNETLKAGQRLVMTPATTGQIGAILSPSSTTSTRRGFSAYYAASSAVVGGTTVGLSFSYATYSVAMTPKRFMVGESNATFTKGSGVPNGGIYFGATANDTISSQKYTGTLGIARIYGSDAQNATSISNLRDNYTPAYTLRPCTYNGEAGLWCVETSTFYGNSAGAGTLSVLNNS